MRKFRPGLLPHNLPDFHCFKGQEGLKVLFSTDQSYFGGGCFELLWRQVLEDPVTKCGGNLGTDGRFTRLL